MPNSEIIQFFNSNLSDIVPNVFSFANTVIAVMGLRVKKSTSAKELEKVKAGKIDEIVSELIDSGALTFTKLYKVKNFLDIAKKRMIIEQRRARPSQSRLRTLTGIHVL